MTEYIIRVDDMFVGRNGFGYKYVSEYPDALVLHDSDDATDLAYELFAERSDNMQVIADYGYEYEKLILELEG